MTLTIFNEEPIRYNVYASCGELNAEPVCTAKTTKEIAEKIIELIYAIENPNNINMSCSINVAIAFGRTELTFAIDIPYQTIKRDIESIEDFIVMNMITKIDFKRFLVEINLNRTFHRDSKLYDVEFIKLFALSISSPELSAPATICLQKIFGLADGHRYDQKQLYIDVFGKDKPKKRIDRDTKKELNAIYGMNFIEEMINGIDTITRSTDTSSGDESNTCKCKMCDAEFSISDDETYTYAEMNYCHSCINAIVSASENLLSYIKTVNNKGEMK